MTPRKSKRAAPQEITPIESDALGKFTEDLRSAPQVSVISGHHRLEMFGRFARGLAMFMALIFVFCAIVVTVGSVTQRFRVVPLLSGSMAPEIETGDAAVLVPVPRGELERGDVIAFVKEDVADKRPTIHRIVEISKLDGGRVVVQTKGDANEIPDQEGVDESGNPLRMSLNSEKVWRVEGNLRNVGWVMLEMAKPRTWFAILGLIGLVLVVSSFKRDEEIETVAPGGIATVGRAMPLLVTPSVPNETQTPEITGDVVEAMRPVTSAEQRFGAVVIDAPTESFS